MPNEVASNSNTILQTIIIILFIAGIAYLIYYLYNQHTMKNNKNFNNYDIDDEDKNMKSMKSMQSMQNMSEEDEMDKIKINKKKYTLSEDDITNVQHKMTGDITGKFNPIMNKVNTLPSGGIVGQNDIEHFSQNENKTFTDERNATSFPKEQLTAAELLPQDNSSLWAQVNPSGDGSLKDKNFLQSGYHIGINTVGQTLRNANLQIRSEPPCPQISVSPWLQSTIQADTSRLPFEIGGCA